jgi:hypothetical protein
LENIAMTHPFGKSIFIVRCARRAGNDGLYESPVMSVSEGTGFHPFVIPARRDGEKKGLPDPGRPFFSLVTQ